MSLTYEVPITVQRAAERALALHRSSALDDVSGISLAEQLATGRATIDQISRIHRFHSVNDRIVEAEMQLMHTAQDSALIRSFELHGAEAGKRWADTIVRRAVSEGYSIPDSTTALLSKHPDEIYDAFSLGAWRFEYDLNPRKAARFLEHYHRATGWNLDLRRAFGDSAGAVGNALHRRLHGPDPFEEAARALEVQDAEYRLAAEMDLADLSESLDEALQKTVFTGSNEKLAAKMVWPAFVAYVILAAERPELLVEMNATSQKPPQNHQKPQSYTAYHDAINTYIAYFHPEGSRFNDPTGAKGLDGLLADVYDLMFRAYYGKKIQAVWAQKLLGRMRRWTAQNKLAGSLFHVFNADWKKANWQHILDAIPPDADVRPYFAEFAKENPVPASGVKLQQTLSSKPQKAAVIDYLLGVFSTTESYIKPVKIDETMTGKYAKQMGTPIGVYTLVSYNGVKSICLGAWDVGAADTVLAFAGVDGKIQSAIGDEAILSSMKSGVLKVLQAHKDMPGTVYGSTSPAQPSGDKQDDEADAPKEGDKVQPFPPDVMGYLKDSLSEASYLSVAKVSPEGFVFFDRLKEMGQAEYAQADTAWYYTPVGEKQKQLYRLVGFATLVSDANKTHKFVIFRGPLSESGRDFFTILDSAAASRYVAKDLVPKTSGATPEQPKPPKSAQPEGVIDPDFHAIAYTIALDAGELLGFSEDDVKYLDLKDTASYTAFKGEFFKGLEVGEELIAGEEPGYLMTGSGTQLYLVGSNTITLGGALLYPNGEKWILFKYGSGGIKHWASDNLFAKKLKGKHYVPKWSLGTSSETLPGDGGATALPGDQYQPPKYKRGDVVLDSQGRKLWVVEYMPDDDDSTYVFQILEIYEELKATPAVMEDSAVEAEKGWELVQSGVFGPVAIAQHLRYQNSAFSGGEGLPKGLLPGEMVTLGVLNWVAIDGVTSNDDGDLYGLFGLQQTAQLSDYWRFDLIPSDELSMVESSYAPPEEKPESSHEDDEPEEGKPGSGKSGTQEAFDFLAKKGWNPAVVSDDPDAFEFPLASVRDYKSGDATRTIIGYGLSDKDAPIYVIKTEKGNVNWVTCANAAKKYGQWIITDEAVKNALLPLPGSDDDPASTAPKLNYKLSRLGKAMSDKYKLEFARRPDDPKPKYHVNTPLARTAGNDPYKYELIGYVPDTEGVPQAILATFPKAWKEGDELPPWTAHSVHSLNTLFEVRYDDPSAYNPTTSEIAWGKDDDEVITIALPSGAWLPSEEPPGWDEPVPVKQPVFGDLPEGKHASAGIIAVIPPGLGVSSSTGVGQTAHPSIIAYKPIGKFGGYSLNLPKGTIDKGESIVKAAVREFWEETGLTVKVVAHLGDFRANTSTNRMFIGYVTGGNPKKKQQPEESAVVRMLPLRQDDVGAPLFQDDPWFADLVPKSGNKWQQKAVLRAWVWMQKNGLPHLAPVDAADYDSAVTGPGDVPATQDGVNISSTLSKSIADAMGSASEIAAETTKAIEQFGETVGNLAKAPEFPKHEAFTPTIPADTFGDNVWKTLYFKCPFPVTDGMVAQLKSKVSQGEAAKPVGFDASRDRGEGPNFGQAFETEQGTPYTAAGYVSWMGEDGNAYHYLLVWSPAGSVSAIQCGPDGLPGSHVLSDQTSMQQDLDAWFQHDDSEINQLIKTTYETGSLPKGITMQTFRLKWCKQAGVPAYAVITKPLLRDVASMFVAGACSQQQHDAIIASLKARMAQTHKKNVATAPVESSTSAQPKAPPVVAPPKTPPKVVQPPAHFESPVYTQYVDNPQPFLFKSTSGKMSGGSKPNAILVGPGGKQWFAKWHGTEAFRAESERAGYQFAQLCKDNNVPVGVMDVEINGTMRHVSFQPVVENSGYPPVNPTELSDDNMAEVLSQHAVDMYMGDHDGHAANWVVQKSGKLAPVDRGQALKFLWMGIEESLDPNWNAPGNIPQLGNEQCYAKHLLKLWGQGKAEIPEVAFAQMRRTIENVQKITDAQILGIVAPVGEALGKSGVELAKVTNALQKRRDSYLKDWTKVLKKLRKDFEWPASSGTGATLDLPATAFQSSPDKLGFGKREEKTIAEAVAAGWQGKSLKIDKDAIEGQEVLVHRVMYQEKPGLNVPATMISMRIARPAGLTATEKAIKNPALGIGVDLSGPHRLKVDTMNGLYEKIWAAIKTVNHHLHAKNDLDINMGTVKTMQDIEPVLNSLIAQTEDPSGTYAPTGEPNEAVYAMAEQYLQYVGIVNYWVAKKEELLGQHSPKLVEFLWEDPPEEDTSSNKPKPAYNVVLKKQGALWPTVNPVDQKNLTVSNLNKPVMNSGSQSQFVIEDPVTKAKVFFNPPGGLSSTLGHAKVGEVGIKDGVESLKGQCWALIPGEPSAATVAHLLALVQDALGIDTSASKPEDTEAMYWSRQVASLQSGGAVKPLPDHTVVKEVEYQKAMAKYQSGDAKGAIADMQKIVAKKTGMSLTEVQKAATPEEIEGHYTRDAGRYRHMRIGWDRDRLVKTMGTSCHVAHHLSDNPLAWMKQMSLNGALLSNATKAFFGVTKTGASPGADMTRGGGQGLFACFRKGFVSHSGMIYFDISLALRLDVYIVGTGDTYGDTGHTRYSTPEQWVKLGANSQTGTCGASSHFQISIRHDIDIREYLIRVQCSSKNQAADCIKIANDLGWTFYNGMKPEEVFKA